MKINHLKKYKLFYIIILSVLNAGVIDNILGFHYNLMVEKFNFKNFFIDLVIYLIATLVSIFIVTFLIKSKDKENK